MAKSAAVFEALGFLKVSKTTSVSTWQVPVYGSVEGKDEYVNILLTEKGREESVNWTTTEEPYPRASEKALWWHVPIGSREITRIEAVTETVPNMVDVAVHWRWHPNEIGEGFDCGGSVVRALSIEARDAAQELGWNSQTEYVANARLRRVGGEWTVEYIHFPNEDEK